MAKLSARGRTTIVRLEKTVEASDANNLAANRVTKEQYTVAMMSDGRALKRTVTWFEWDGYGPNRPRRHDYGWKDMGRLKDGTTADTFAAHFERRGYRKEA